MPPPPLPAARLPVMTELLTLRTASELFWKFTDSAPPSSPEWLALNVLLVTIMVSLAPTRASAPPRPRVAVLPKNSTPLMAVVPNLETSPPPHSFAAQPAAVLFRNRTLEIVKLEGGKKVTPPSFEQPPPSGAHPKKSTAPPGELTKSVFVLLPFWKITLAMLRLPLVSLSLLVEMNLSFQAVPPTQTTPDVPPQPWMMLVGLPLPSTSPRIVRSSRTSRSPASAMPSGSPT